MHCARKEVGVSDGESPSRLGVLRNGGLVRGPALPMSPTSRNLDRRRVLRDNRPNAPRLASWEGQEGIATTERMRARHLRLPPVRRQDAERTPVHRESNGQQRSVPVRRVDPQQNGILCFASRLTASQARDARLHLTPRIAANGPQQPKQQRTMYREDEAEPISLLPFLGSTFISETDSPSTSLPKTLLERHPKNGRRPRLTCRLTSNLSTSGPRPPPSVITSGSHTLHR